MRTEPGAITGESSERDAIIESAFACISEPHAGAVSVADILARTGLSTRAFYRHFASKDGLYVAMLRGAGDSLARRLDGIAERDHGDPTAQLRAWLGQLLCLLDDSRWATQAVALDSDEVRAAKGYRAALERWHTERERSLAVILRRGRDDGSFPQVKPEQDAVAIGAVVTHVMSRMCSDGECEVTHDEVVDFALRAVGATASARDR